MSHDEDMAVERDTEWSWIEWYQSYEYRGLVKWLWELPGYNAIINIIKAWW